MPADVSATKARGGTRRRRKTGCYTCRSRHIRCDEEKPVCGNCRRKGYDCKQAEFIINSTWLSTPTAPLPRGQESEHEHSPSSTWDVFNFSRNGLQRLSVPTAPTLPPPRARVKSLDPETAELLRVYQNDIATWLDLFDHSLSYQREVPRRALKSQLIRESICALSAKQLDLIGKGYIWSSVAARRYGESLRLLIEACVNPEFDQEEVLTATILLSSFELLAAPGPDHKKHLFGATTLVKSRHINGKCTGLDRAAFWIYVRQDLAMALINECSTYFPPDEWNVSWSDIEQTEDVLGNHILWICSHIVNFLFASDALSSERRQFDSLATLMDAVNAWFDRLPDTFKGVPSALEGHVEFEELWFPVPAAAAAMATYHEAKLLLLAETSKRHSRELGEIEIQIQYHASQIGSIALSKIPHGALVQTVQPLYFAAKHIEGPHKKAKLWSILSDIEVRLGFHTASRIQQLHKPSET